MHQANACNASVSGGNTNDRGPYRQLNPPGKRESSVLFRRIQQRSGLRPSRLSIAATMGSGIAQLLPRE